MKWRRWARCATPPRPRRRQRAHSPPLAGTTPLGAQPPAAANCSPGESGITPPIDGLDADAISLTKREKQLVELASRGLSTADIADRLVLSIRTVESTLYRAMQTLGIGDRRDL
jgi:DNA-binding CsgD family transcriptional regulator